LEPNRDAIAVSGSRSVWLPAIAGSHVANEIGHRRSGQSSDHISPGQELDGVLGDKFNFETPTNGGTLNILTASIHRAQGFRPVVRAAGELRDSGWRLPS